MLPGIDGGERMANARQRMPRRLDDAVDFTGGENLGGVFRQIGGACLAGIPDAGGRCRIIGPADAGERSPGVPVGQK